MSLWPIAGSVVVLGTAGVAAYGAVAPGSQLFGATTCYTNAARKLALTFDDGPNPAITPKLLDLLRQYDAAATFFVVGKYVRESAGLLKEIAEAGHALGNHTETHPNLFFEGPSATREQLLRCGDAIENVTWARPRWFRPPFGFRSPWLSEIVHAQGMRTVMWTRIPGDWRVVKNDWLIERMKPIAVEAEAGLKAGSGPAPGQVICLHDGDYARPNADRAHTLAALQYWLPRWRDLGLQFVTMSQATE